MVFDSFPSEIFTNNKKANHSYFQVSGLVGCADLLACNFTLASFLAYTRYEKMFSNNVHFVKKSLLTYNMERINPCIFPIWMIVYLLQKSFHTSSLGTTYQCRIQNIKKTICNFKRKLFLFKKINSI